MTIIKGCLTILLLTTVPCYGSRLWKSRFMDHTQEDMSPPENGDNMDATHTDWENDNEPTLVGESNEKRIVNPLDKLPVKPHDSGFDHPATPSWRWFESLKPVKWQKAVDPDFIDAHDWQGLSTEKPYQEPRNAYHWSWFERSKPKILNLQRGNTDRWILNNYKTKLQTENPRTQYTRKRWMWRKNSTQSETLAPVSRDNAGVYNWPTTHRPSRRPESGLETTPNSYENECKLVDKEPYVKVDGNWGKICGEKMTSKEAGVVCHRLGYSRYGARIDNETMVFQEKSVVLFWYLKCTGEESRISECETRSLIREECDSRYRVHITCQKRAHGIGSRQKQTKWYSPLVTYGWPVVGILAGLLVVLLLALVWIWCSPSTRETADDKENLPYTNDKQKLLEVYTVSGKPPSYDECTNGQDKN